MKIQTKISSIIFVLILVTGIVAITSSYIVSKQMIEFEIYHHLESIAISRGYHIETLLDEQAELVKIFATDTVFIDALTTENITPAIQKIKALIDFSDDISRVRVLDKQGNVVISSHSEIDPIDNAKIFAHSKGGVYISDIHISAMTGTKVISISAPILVKGEFAGIIIVNIEVEKELYEIILYRYRKTGEIYLINKAGYMITPSRFIDDTFLKQKVDSLEARKCFELSEEETESAKIDNSYEDYRGELVIGTHHTIKGMDWCLLSEIDAEEAFAPVNRLVQLMFLFFMLLLGVGSLLAFITAKNLTRPILKLHRRASEIEKGNWDYQVTVDSQDEIGEFSNAFDSMTAQLKNAQDELECHQNKLERQVSERTAELSQRIQEIEQQKIGIQNLAEDLVASQQRYESLVNSIDGVVWEGDANTFQFQFVSQHTQRILGYPSEDWLKPRFWADHIHPDDREWAMTYCANAVAEKRDHNFEYRMITADKRTIWLRDLVTVVVENDKAVKLYGVMFDITERKQAEITLEKSEKRFRALFDKFPVAYQSLDENGCFLDVNPEMEQLLGYHAAEMLGKPFGDFWDKETNHMFSNAFCQFKECGIANNELHLLKKNGEKVTIIINGRIQYDGKGKYIRSHCTLHDITERKRMETQLIAAKEAADAANRAKSEFLANMSHEIRTPMNAVIGFSDILATKITDKKQKNHLNSIQTAGKSLLTLINDILDLSKIEAGRLDIQYEPMNPQLIFTELQQIFSLKMADKNLEWIMEIDENLPKALFLDETRLRQVLLNLMGNAIKFTDSGYVKLCANKIDTEEGHVDLILAVEDSGIGIPADQQVLIFESFRQQDGQSTRQYGGTGLGLTITKRLVEMMNGQISVESVPNKGSRFEITLREVKMATTPNAKQEETFDLNNITFEKAQVLVVDDTESHRYLIEEYLSLVNLEVICAASGQEALQFVEESHPALILMDLRMPEMDGYEVTKHLKDNPNTADIPIIALTASVALNEKAKTEAHGFDGYLVKPISISELLRELSGYLQYTQKAGTDAPQVAPPVVDSTLNPATIVNLPELINQLEQFVLPLWEEANIIMEMDTLAELAEKMIELGNEYNIPVFIHYGEPLLESTQIFDIAYIQKALKELPEMIKPLIE